METIIPLASIRAAGACLDDYRIVARQYPRGVPLTYAAGDDLIERGVDVPWFLLTLLTPDQRVDFLLFSLELRRGPLAQLLDRAGLADEAGRVRALRFRTVADAAAALAILDAARDAARDAAWAAARAAARDAARDAAWKGSRRAMVRWLLPRLLRSEVAACVARAA